MYRKLVRGFIFPFLLVFGTWSCTTSRQLPYFKDLREDVGVSTIETARYQPLQLQTNDELQIAISSISPEASRFFNPAIVTPSAPSESAPGGYQSQGNSNLYRVSLEGIITLPVLGDIKAAGLTTEELKASIKEKLKDYLKDPIVMVRLTNFKVTVIGEVGAPVVIPVNGQTINILEAIGAAGDMTVYGIRKNVKVIRKLPDGKTEVAILDFNKVNLLQSPWFQLRQNDVIYVQPNKNKTDVSNRANIWVPIVTSLLTSAAIIFSRNN